MRWNKLPLEATLLTHLLLCCSISLSAAGPSERNDVAYTWKTESWGSCRNRLNCGEGLREREVTCRDLSRFTVDDSNCDASEKPPSVERCFRICEMHKHMLRWTLGEWSPCIPSEPSSNCVESYVSGTARRTMTCVLDPSHQQVENAACETFWGRPESEMSCSLDCPQDCVVTRRNVSCHEPYKCSKGSQVLVEVSAVVVAPTAGGASCPSLSNQPVCPTDFSTQTCKDTPPQKKRYLLKIGEWGPCESSDNSSGRTLWLEKEVRISLHPVVGISRRNISCITDQGDAVDISLCNVAEPPTSARQCVVPLPCLTSPWTEWRVRREGCIRSDGEVLSEIRTRVRKLVQMPVGMGSEPCPPLYEERSISQDLPSCYKYQWLPLEWSKCEVRLHKLHNEVDVIRPDCGSGIQYRNLTCVRASDLSPVSDELCHEPPPPSLQRCQVACRRDCQVSHWSRWGPCTALDTNDFYSKEGYRLRERSVLVSPSMRGTPCPYLQQADTCHGIEIFNWRYGNWSECHLENPQAVCGTGSTIRSKTCVKLSGVPLDEYVCKSHHFAFVEDDCRVPCPDDCVLSEWSQWSTCSKSCNYGIRTRNRTLLAVKGPKGDCVNFDVVELSSEDDCNYFQCLPYRWVVGEWDDCTLLDEQKPCGVGLQKRQVSCMFQKNTTSADKICDYLQKPKMKRKCHLPCPVDCVVTHFSDWTPCNATCLADGVEHRWRVVVTAARHGGKPCPTALLEKKLCTRWAAMDYSTSRELMCLGRSPRHRWSTGQWGECHIADETQFCGTGFQVRNVSCEEEEGRSVEPYHCLNEDKQGSSSVPPALRSCEVTCSGCVLTTWSEWTPCEYTYLARRYRRRELVGDRNCSLTEKLLEEEPCPAIPESLITGSSAADHWLSCIVEKPTPALVNGHLVRHDCGEGYRYRFDLENNIETGIGPGLVRDFCLVDCPLDCQMSSWSEWTLCSAPCGQGFIERRRDVLVPANYLGRPCPPDVVNNTEIQRDVCRSLCSDFLWLADGWSDCISPQKKKCGNSTRHRSVKCINKWTEEVVSHSRCDPLSKPDATASCRLHCPRECVVSEWTVTQTCTEPCSNSNYQEMTRTVLRHPRSASPGCPPLVSRSPCVLNETCHDHTFLLGDWGSCMGPEGALCGEGVQRRPLQCVRSDGRQVDAVQCEKIHKSISSNEPLSKPCYIECPMDCVMTQWSSWNSSTCTPCSLGGVMVRTRTVLLKPTDSGQSCPAEKEQRKPCPFQACYHWRQNAWSSCDLEKADCGHGVRRRVVDCVRFDGLRVDRNLCLTVNVTFPRNGTWLDLSWLALAQEESEEAQPCVVPCPDDCIHSEWSEWSHCQKNCRIGQIVGFKTSSRQLLFGPKNGSHSCPEQLWRTRPCWSNDCNFYRWKLKNGSLICEGRDGSTVHGGCTSESRPCDYWCERLGGHCNSSTSMCRCPGGDLLTGANSPPCGRKANGPRPPANHSAPASEIKYYPDDSQVSFWMYAMISIGTAFVIFVAVTVYLMCRSRLRYRPSSMERQPTVYRRPIVSSPVISNHVTADVTENSTGA